MATVLNAGAGTVDVLEGSGPSIVILVALMIVFGAAAYFTGTLYGKIGMYAIIAGFVVVVSGLYLLGGIHFG